jgi:prevent-host-death family protein
MKWLKQSIMELFDSKGDPGMDKIMTATSDELQNNLDKYLNLVMEGQQVIITRNGRKAVRIIPEDTADSCLTDSLTGILKGDDDLDKEKNKALKAKSGVTG